jgi:tetratricopeptide (TPR) repeat protein
MKLHKLVSMICDIYRSDKPIAFYVAAGISKDCPAHLPLGKELGYAIISGFLELEKKHVTLLGKALERRPLEEVCGVVQHELEDKDRLVAMMAKALDNDTIGSNLNHRFLAKALHEGHLVVTTNFDRMIECAYKDIYCSSFPIEHICYDNPTFERFLEECLIKGFKRSENKPGWLLKLHGTFHYGTGYAGHSVMTTLERVGKNLPPKAQEALIQVLRNCPLLFLGYGCMDIDIIYPVLIETPSSQPIWWVKHNHGEQIIEYDGLRDTLQREESKVAWEVDVPTTNIVRVLCRRGEHNGGNVWQINVFTSLFIEALMAQIGGSFGTIKSCTGGLLWSSELHELGHQVSALERILTLAKLAQTCASDDRLLYDCSDELFQTALPLAADPQGNSRIYQEMGWNKYRQDPEKNAKQAAELYNIAKDLTPTDFGGRYFRHVMIEALRALAFRRERNIGEALKSAEAAWNLLPESVRSIDLPIAFEDIRLSLEKLDIKQQDFGNFGAVLRRVAGVYNQCVSGPITLATSINCEYHWIIDDREKRLLERALGLLKVDHAIQQMVGARKEKIQSENELGLVCSKLEDGNTAMDLHKESCIIAQMYGWRYELAQASRNWGLAYETSGDRVKAVSRLKESMELFKLVEATGYRKTVGDVNTTLWHIGRIQIKCGKDGGIEDIEEHLKNPDINWHWKANDHALLGIGYFDIKGDPAAGRRHFDLMMKQYLKEDDTLDEQALKNQTYGVDNALANVVAAVERLRKDSSAEAASLRTKLTSLRKQLEKLRFEALESFPIK